ncbi:hypothetical protein AAZV13_13G058600 [Glycine max]
MKAEEQQLQPSKLYLLGSRSNPRHQWGVGKAETSQDSSCPFEEEKINFALYPSLQGGLRNNHTAVPATALEQGKVPMYKPYIQQVKKSALASALLKRKCRLATNETHNHLLLCDLTILGLIGNLVFFYSTFCNMSQTL